MHYCFLTVSGCEGNASFVRLRELGNELARRSHRVSFVVDDSPHNQRTLPPVLHPACHIEWVRPFAGPLQVVARRDAIKLLSPDWLHILNPYPKAFAAVAGIDVPVVADWDEWRAMSPNLPGKHQLAQFLDHWMRRRGKRLVVASRYMQDQFLRLFDARAAYIPYATYLEARPDGPSPYTEPTAVYMGQMYSVYDHDLLFEAAHILADRRVVPRIDFLGGGPELEKWRSWTRARHLDNVTCRGYLTGDALWQRLRHARVLLFPIRPSLNNLSRCPSKTFAYAQTRRPIITNRTGEVPAVLGDRAQYVETTAQAFADAIDHALLPEMQTPDVEYDLSRQNWSQRCDDLLTALD